MNSKSFLSTAITVSLLSLSSVTMATEDKSLPFSYQDVFNSAMESPNVMIYYGDKAYQEGDFETAMRWFLKAAEFEHPAAVENAKHLIRNSQGSFENREYVVEFLKYYAEPRGDTEADVFARLYLADYYRGDSCVWFDKSDISACEKADLEPSSESNLRQSYYYYQGASEQGDDRATYISAMMNILGLGVPRNVPLGVSKLKVLADKESVSASHIIGEIYQRGYWLPQDKAEANKWLIKPASAGVPSAIITMARNVEAGHSSVDKEEGARALEAREMYLEVLDSSLASHTEKAEAAYRLAVLTETYKLKDGFIPSALMQQAVNHGKHEANEFSVKALIWQGDVKEKDDLKKAIKIYDRAIAMLETLPLNVQQRHAVVWQKVAYAYANGRKGQLSRDERKFSTYMNRHHRVLSTTFVPSVDLFEFADYSAFDYKG